MEYNYVLTVHYDNDYKNSFRFSDAITAVESFQKCSDHGDAKQYATYSLVEPNGKIHNKTHWRNKNGK